MMTEQKLCKHLITRIIRGIDNYRICLWCPKCGALKITDVGAWELPGQTVDPRYPKNWEPGTICKSHSGKVLGVMPNVDGPEKQHLLKLIEEDAEKQKE